MKLRVKSIDSYQKAVSVIECDFTGEAIRDHYNRELAKMGCPVSRMYSLSYWDVTHNGTVAQFVLKGNEHFLAGIAHVEPLEKPKITK